MVFFSNLLKDKYKHANKYKEITHLKINKKGYKNITSNFSCFVYLK